MSSQQTIEKPPVRRSFAEGVSAATTFASNKRNRLLLAAIGLAVLLAIGVIWGLARSSGGAAGVTANSQFYDVVPMDMQITLAKRGDLDAINNIDIMSQVEGQPVIQQLIPEGDFAKKGQVLCVLDSADLRVKIEDSSIEVQRAEADLTTAREAKIIQENINTANLEAAKVSLQLSELDLSQYIDGTYPQSLADAKRSVEMSRITVTNKQKDLEQTNNLFAKGFVTAADVEQSKLDVLTAQNDLDKNTTALMVLQKYTHERNQADYHNKQAQAQAALARTERENASSIAQLDADLEAKSQNFTVRKRRLERLKEQLEACTLKAPADGIVVYATSVASNRNNQNPIAEGVAVRERQPILRIPDTSSMKVVVRINEANVPRLQAGLVATVTIPGVPQPLKATLSKISVLADSSQRWFNPDLKEYPVELTLDSTPPHLKPGMGADVVIVLDQLKQATVVPLPAIYTADRKNYVFTSTGGTNVRLQEVKIGRSNDSFIEVTSGIKPGDKVLLLGIGQGQQLAENLRK